MKIKYTVPCIVILLYACNVLKPTAITQGLAGQVYLLTGNQMPVFGRTASKGRAVSRDIYIFEPTTFDKTSGNAPLFSQIKTKLIAQTRSDSTGRYAIKLPAGKYSVFVKEGDKFFASLSDGSGIVNPAIVTDNNITQKDITINNNASY